MEALQASWMIHAVSYCWYISQKMVYVLHSSLVIVVRTVSDADLLAGSSNND